MNDPAAPRKRLRILLVAAGAVFVVYNGFLSIGLPVKFASPDESANYLFIKSFATRSSLILPSPLTVPGGIVGPRSMLMSEGELLPASFLGMPLLYGVLARVIGMWVVPILTSLFTYGALLALYGLFARVFTKRIALVSSALVALHPAVWYATVRGMFHNMLFVDFAIFGVYAMVRGFETVATRSQLWFGLSGLSFGAAVAVRSSEVLWIGAGLMAVMFVRRTSSALRREWWVFIAGGLLPVMIIMVTNQHLYGHPLSFGYSGGAVSTDTLSGLTSTLAEKFSGLLFPFGFHPVRAIANFINYSVRLFWLPTLLSLLGIVSLVRMKRVTTVQRWFYIGSAAISAWLILYYGSWLIQDSPTPDAVTIGTSYVRYWLPVYILTMPLAGMFILRVQQQLPRVGRAVMVVAACAVWFTSALTVLFDPLEGALALRGEVASYGQHNERAGAMTPSNAVIISTRGDKEFFPERSVITSVETPAQLKQLRELLVKVPVYVHVPAAESPAMAAQAWTSRGFRLTAELTLAPEERLYRLQDGIDRQGAAEVQ